MTEHTRLLGEVSPALKDLPAETRRIRKGEIAKPVREITPLSLRVHELAAQCTRQGHDLSVSQYPAMEGGAESLAYLAGACAQISLAATLCNLAIHHRTEILLSEDADPTPAASAEQLRLAGEEMQRAATTYRTVAQQLSRRLASAAPRPQILHRGSRQAPAKPMAPAPAPAPQNAPTVRRPA
ncbi:hypothetical protein ABT278_14595 [Streptomyces sp. NPDC001228]|uniref:hypothetical protein n=1 Tax=Streptomyces sp. NPDC001228 TaxID=3154381 RepID=UPI00332C7EAD